MLQFVNGPMDGVEMTVEEAGGLKDKQMRLFGNLEEITSNKHFYWRDGDKMIFIRTVTNEEYITWMKKDGAKQ